MNRPQDEVYKRGKENPCDDRCDADQLKGVLQDIGADLRNAVVDACDDHEMAGVRRRQHRSLSAQRRSPASDQVPAAIFDNKPVTAFVGRHGPAYPGGNDRDLADMARLQQGIACEPRVTITLEDENVLEALAESDAVDEINIELAQGRRLARDLERADCSDPLELLVLVRHGGGGYVRDDRKPADK
jgi:hypothetical protein